MSHSGGVGVDTGGVGVDTGVVGVDTGVRDIILFQCVILSPPAAKQTPVTFECVTPPDTVWDRFRIDPGIDSEPWLTWRGNNRG